MKNKRFVLALMAATLAAAATVGGTFAYLTGSTEKKQNVFTNESELKGRIEEDFDSETAESYIPGDVITKVPVVTLDHGSEDAFIAMKVECIDGSGKKIPMSEFIQKYGSIQTKKADGTYIDGYNTEDWIEVETVGDENFYLYGDSEELTTMYAGTSTTPIFDQVTVNVGIKEELTREYQTTTIYEQDENGNYQEVSSVTEATGSVKRYYVKDENGNMVETDVTSLPNFQINVTGYLVQAKGNNYTDAVKELEDLAEVTEK